ncbi:MAG: FeoB-associated Cys-rich membrane protein [Bacteroidales bacterium]
MQDIFVFVVILLAAAYAGWKLYRKLRPKVDEVCETTPTGCGGCGEDCALRDVKHGKKKYVAK